MIYCFTLSQVIFLRHFLVALKGNAYTADGNSASKAATKNDTSNTSYVNSTNEATRGDVFFTTANLDALKWAVGLLVTELVSVLLIAWSLSILYRLACS
jgi:hypothetical protein